MTVLVRPARDDDWPQIWPIIEAIVAEQETFAYDPAMSEEQAETLWMVPPPARVVVANVDGRVAGTANMYANRPGPGSHVASGSLMVAADARGAGSIPAPHPRTGRATRHVARPVNPT